MTALLGANGAGKTTTLRAISGHDPPRGRHPLRGEPMAALSTEDVARLGVAHVPDGRGTFTDLTVEENLRLGAYMRKDRRAVAAGFRPGLRLFPARSPSGGGSRPARCRAASSRCSRSAARC